MTNSARKVRTSFIAQRAKSEGLSEADYLSKLLEQHGNQAAIAAALKVTQSAVSQAFKRNGFKPVIRYEIEVA